MNSNPPGPQASPDVVKATVSALAASIAAVGNQAASQANAFAERFGPAAAQWGVELAAARAAGDTETAVQKTESLRLLAADAALVAADLGVSAQAATENALLGALMTAAHFAPLLAAVA